MAPLVSEIHYRDIDGVREPVSLQQQRVPLPPATGDPEPMSCFITAYGLISALGRALMPAPRPCWPGSSRASLLDRHRRRCWDGRQTPVGG